MIYFFFADLRSVNSLKLIIWNAYFSELALINSYKIECIKRRKFQTRKGSLYIFDHLSKKIKQLMENFWFQGLKNLISQNLLKMYLLWNQHKFTFLKIQWIAWECFSKNLSRNVIWKFKYYPKIVIFVGKWKILI